jgi:prepilin-type N-terminal cleavage/methylation domain-containing protein
MMNFRKVSIQRNNGEQGFSLIEVLVATAVLAIAFTVALLLYNTARQSFKKGENAAVNQQGVRLGYDALVADLRMSGYNFNPDGAANRPDEQIEGAFARAITVRADFDANDPVASLAPETSLEGGQFLSVSTGNDEIVTYVLAKPDGSSTGSIRIDVDVAEAQRDADVEAVTITNVAVTHNNPPYTLYRITLNNDTSTFGNASFFVREPIVDNVRSLDFQYFDQAGNDITTTVTPIGGVDTAAAKIIRGSIARIGVQLVGMTEDPDNAYVDPDETIASAVNHRKFSVSGLVSPRNFGMKGQRDLSTDVTPPSKPATPTLEVGHCGGIFVSWTANPVSEQIAYYRVSYGLTAAAADESRSSGATSLYMAGLNDATQYWVKIFAVDAAGNVSIPSDAASTTTTNVNTPQAPTNPAVQSGLVGAVRLTWNAVTQNTQALPAFDPAAPTIRDLAGYRVYRSDASNFAGAVMIADETVNNPAASPAYADSQSVACKTYYYKVSAVDACGVESALTTVVSGASTATIAPAVPINVQAFFGGPNNIIVDWDPVDTNVNDESIYIERYEIWKTPLQGDLITDPAPASILAGRVTNGDSVFTDNQTIGSGYTVFYGVKAQDSCPNTSAMSELAQPTCAFGGDVVFLTPSSDEPVAGVVQIRVEVQNPTDAAYTDLQLDFLHKPTGTLQTLNLGSADPPSWYHEWLANPSGPYQITATVTNDTGCTKSTSIDVAAGYDVGCCLSPPTPDIDPLFLTCAGGSLKCRLISYEMINNNCLTSVAIEDMTVSFTDDVANGALLQSVSFDGNTIWNVSPNSPSPANNSFDSDGNGMCDLDEMCPSLGIDRDTTNPVTVSYLFSEEMAVRARRSQPGVENRLQTEYQFRLLDSSGSPTSITGTCGPSTGIFHNLQVEAQ